jgi:hypothetical protein
MPGTGCSTWRAAPGWPSNWLACAALPALVSMPRPGWSRWPGTGAQMPTSGSAICTPCRGARRRSMSSLASGGSGAPHLARWPRSTGSFAPADAPGLRCGVTSRRRPEPGRWRRGAWPRRRRSTTRRRWWRWAGLGRVSSSSSHTDSSMLSAVRFRSPGSSRTRNCSRGPRPLPGRVMRPSRTSARPSSIAWPSSRPKGSCGMACRCGPKSRSWATWPANPKTAIP